MGLYRLEACLREWLVVNTSLKYIMSIAQDIQLINLLCETLRVLFRDMQEAPETLLMLEPNAQRWHSSIGRLSNRSWVYAQQ